MFSGHKEVPKSTVVIPKNLVSKPVTNPCFLWNPFPIAMKIRGGFNKQFAGIMYWNPSPIENKNSLYPLGFELYWTWINKSKGSETSYCNLRIVVKNIKWLSKIESAIVIHVLYSNNEFMSSIKNTVKIFSITIKIIGAL